MLLSTLFSLPEDLRLVDVRLENEELTLIVRRLLFLPTASITQQQKRLFFCLSRAYVFQTMLSTDVKEKAIATLISVLNMVHSTRLLIIDAIGKSNGSCSSTAWRTLQGFEVMNMVRKGQVQGVTKGDVQGQVTLVAQLFGVAVSTKQAESLHPHFLFLQFLATQPQSLPIPIPIFIL